MANRTFSSQERYKRVGTEPRKKLKKVRSVKVANLDKLRLSMKKERNRFNGGSELSQSSSSPNYMKATTSSSARKGSLQGNSTINEKSVSLVKSSLKFSEVDIPVEVKPEKSQKIIKKVPSLRNSKKLSSKKSMRIRARYSQFSDVEIDKGEIEILDTEITSREMEIDAESLNVDDYDFKNGVGMRQKGILERSRSRKLIKIRSIRSSRTKQRTKSRFSGEKTEVMPFEAQVSEPHYMKATTSQQARKNANKGLTRTSSLRPLRILAKIPSLRTRRSKVKKIPQKTPLSETHVHRPTCSSTLKRTKFSDDIQLQSRDRELEGSSSLHICPYTYCSIHGHRHHTSQQPLKEFISAKRKLFSNQKGEQSENQSGGGKNVSSATETETDQSGEIFPIEIYTEIDEVMSFTTENSPEYEDEGEDDGMDIVMEKYTKPRKKWATESTMSQDVEAFNLAIYDHINSEQYEEKLAETLSESSGIEEKQGALNDGRRIQQQNNIISAISSPCEFCEIGPKPVSISETLEPSITELQRSLNDPSLFSIRVSEPNPENYLTDILSDKKKYTSMWQLIHQELVSNKASMSEALGDIQVDEQERDGGKTYSEMSNKEDMEDDIGERKKLELEKTSAIKLVQGVLNAILQHDTKSFHNENIREDGQKDEKGIDHESEEKRDDVKQTGNMLLNNEDPKEQELVGVKMSKSLSKLRKMFMTAKFIKAMERLKRIDPHKPQYLSREPSLEKERVYLRHLSTKERKGTDEWMLDYALRQVISRMDSEKQRRVAKLVEAFERVVPEKEEKSNKPFTMASMPNTEREIAMSTNEEKKQFVEFNRDLSFSRNERVEKQDARDMVFHINVSERENLKEEFRYLVNKTDNDIMEESVETQIPDSTLVLSEKSSNSVSMNKASNDEATVNEKPINNLKFPSENPTQDSEVNLAGDMTNIFINKQKYTSMWNLIYQHVSTETPVNQNQGIDGLDENEQGSEENSQYINGANSTSSSYCVDQNEDNYDNSMNSQRPDLDQSTAIKLVKEAVSSILNSYEQPTYTERSIDLSTSQIEGKSTGVENTSFSLQQEVESSEKFKEPERKMSKSLNKLKKAIATTRFIKAMERLMKNSPRKSQNSSPNTTLQEEKVHLRHGSVNGRKKDEEWMLDYALRQVILKLDPDQQRRVALLVEAFETMQLEKKDMRTRSSLKGEAIDFNELVTHKSDLKENNLEPMKEQCISTEKVHHKQDDDIVLTTRDAFPEKSLEEDDQQASSEGDILVKEINKSIISDSTLESSAYESKTSVVHELEEQSVGDVETGRAIELTSTFPTENSEVKPEGEMDNILFDKQRYTNIWHLIYQHVLSNKESTTAKQEVNDNEEEKGDNTNISHELNDSSSTQSTQPKKSKLGDDNQSGASDQSEAIHLVKEAIHAILQDHERGADNSSELEEHKIIEREKKIQIVENTRAPLEEGTRKFPKSFNKLKRAIATAKFIKAIEKLRKINPHKPRYLDPEATLEEERVYLRHLSMNERKNDEEWMLDYALRKVISELDPDQQRKVTRLVKAFETVNPELKGIKKVTRTERDMAVHFESKTDKEGIFESKQDSSIACDDIIPSMNSDKLNMVQTSDPIEESLQEDQSINLSYPKMKFPRKSLDLEDSAMDIHHQANAKGTTFSENVPTKMEEIDDTNPMHEPILAANDFENERNDGITKGLFGDKQKNSSMWLLVSQHVNSVNDAESRITMNERPSNEEQINKDDTPAKMIDEKTSTSPRKFDLESESNHSTQESGSLRKSTNLWGLILQRVTTDMLEKEKAPESITDENEPENSEKY